MLFWSFRNYEFGYRVFAGIIHTVSERESPRSRERIHVKSSADGVYCPTQHRHTPEAVLSLDSEKELSVYLG